MGKWIDADALIAEMQKDEAMFDKEAEDAEQSHEYTQEYINAMRGRADGIRDCIVEVYDAPHIDIVRCKECKNYDRGACKRWHDDVGFWEAVNPDDFCSYGEVRDE